MNCKDNKVIYENYLAMPGGLYNPFKGEMHSDVQVNEDEDSEEIIQGQMGLAPTPDIHSFPPEALQKALKGMLDLGYAVMVDTHTGSAQIEDYEQGSNTFMASTDDGESVDVSVEDVVRITGMDKMDDGVSTPELPDEKNKDDRADAERSMAELMSRGHSDAQRMQPKSGEGGEQGPGPM